MQHCPSCESTVETKYDCPDCGEDYCAECRAPVYHDCSEHQSEPEPEATVSDSSPGLIKQNIGWIVAIFMGLGNLTNQSTPAGPGELLGQIMGICLGVALFGYLFQNFNGWNTDPT